MSFEPDFRAKLKAATDAGVYWDARPQGSALPAVVIEMIFGRDDQHYGGSISTQGHRLQVRVIATTQKQAAEIRDALKAEIKRPGDVGSTTFQGGIINYFGSGVRNTPEQETFSQVIDADVWYN